MNESDILWVFGYSSVLSNPSDAVVFNNRSVEEVVRHQTPSMTYNTFRVRNPIEDASAQHPYRSFANIVSGDYSGAIPLHQRTIPRSVGGKIAITIREDKYEQGLAQFRCCLIGRLVLSKGDGPLMTKDLKQKLSGVWGVNADSWFITPMGRG